MSERVLLGDLSAYLGETGQVDLDRGVFRPEQKRGKVGNYEVKENDDRVMEVETIFKERRLDRDYGERLYFVAEVRQKMGPA